MIPTKSANLPQVASMIDGQLYDIVYMGDRELKMFKLDHTLYIIDPKINSPEKISNAVSYFTIDELPSPGGLVDFFSQEAIQIKDVSQEYYVKDSDSFESYQLQDGFIRWNE